MSAPLAEVLLRIAAAVVADGGTGVRKALETALREAAPFDAGEIVFVRARGEHVHLPLGGDEGPLLGADLVAHVLAHGAPYRIDDWPDAEPFPEAHRILRARDLRSTLVLPFLFEAAGTRELAGVLGVARAHGWAYVGASLPLLVPLAGMAGLAVDRALTLSALAERARAFEAVSPWGASVEEGQARNAARELMSRAETAEERLHEAERARDDWAQQTSRLRARLAEQKGKLQSLQRALAGARETAAAAADLAEAREVRARELEASVRTLERELRGAHERVETPPLEPAGNRPPERRARRRNR